MNSRFVLVLFISAIFALAAATNANETSLAELKTAFVDYFEPLTSTSNLLDLPPSIFEKYIDEALESNQTQLTSLWREVRSAVKVERRLTRAMEKVSLKFIGSLGGKKPRKAKPDRALHRKWTMVREELQWATNETAKKVMKVKEFYFDLLWKEQEKKTKKKAKNSSTSYGTAEWTLVIGQLLMEVVVLVAWRYDTVYREKQWNLENNGEDENDNLEDESSTSTTA